MDFGKFKYQQQKKAAGSPKEADRHPAQGNQGPPEDRRTRLSDQAQAYPAISRCRGPLQGHRVLQGPRIVHKDRGLTILSRIVEDLGELAKMEQEPKTEGRTMTMLLAPQPKK
jgi:translation initiation factor IF-3